MIKSIMNAIRCWASLFSEKNVLSWFEKRLPVKFAAMIM
ncbi:MAG: hypothetical protein Hyperionvirus17_41 [Hyperionvirus sp.]|uniref:Uncharacterized protein n=1 Tax=Hyperionvirus sp. TaxID=2487770 RepID=A0A3G5ACZ3_9VIRU|nr:MAG: hypothetical protein Hyperionvirus17_41 [Hyperionvirus sp.]